MPRPRARLMMLALLLPAAVRTAGAAPAGSLPAIDAPPDAAVDRLIAELDDDNPSVRETATRELIRRGPAVAIPVRRALESADSPEVRLRARHVLEHCDGWVVNGLKIRLAADRTALHAGDTVRLMTTIQNVTDDPLNLYVGYSTGGVDFESGSAFRIVEGEADSSGGIRETAPKWNVGFCGTGAGPLFVTIPANGCVTYTTTATRIIAPASPPTPAAGNGRPAAPHYRLGEHSYMILDAPTPGVHRFHVAHAVTAQQNMNRGMGGRRGPSDASAPYWEGAIQSNEVAITVSDSPAPARPTGPQ